MTDPATPHDLLAAVEAACEQDQPPYQIRGLVKVLRAANGISVDTPYGAPVSVPSDELGDGDGFEPPAMRALLDPDERDDDPSGADNAALNAALAASAAAGRGQAPVSDNGDDDGDKVPLVDDDQLDQLGAVDIIRDGDTPATARVVAREPAAPPAPAHTAARPPRPPRAGR